MGRKTKSLRIFIGAFVFLLCLAFGFTEGIKADSDDLLEINAESFPDEVFREYVASRYDRDKDGYVSKEALGKAKSLSVSDMEIGSLKGIEYFTGIKELNCKYNNITELDLSQNKQLQTVICEANQISRFIFCEDCPLEFLDCQYNALTTLDISNLFSLKRLECRFNNIEEIDLSHNTGLLYLNMAGNKLKKLDVSENKWLVWLYAQWNEISELNLGENKNLSVIQLNEDKLTELDLSKIPMLTHLLVYKNNLSSLDLSHNPYLVELDCKGNNLTELNLSENKHLNILQCGDNHITALDVSHLLALTTLYAQNNNLTALDISGNLALSYVSCSNNSISVLDISNNPYLEASDVRVPKTASIVDNFAPIALNTENFPDDNLKAVLSEISGDDDGQLDRGELKKLKILELADRNITDMTGLELLPGVEKLDISNNTVSALCLNDNRCISELICVGCGLKTLDISRCASLSKLDCSNNEISDLDLTQNRDMDWLDCSGNQMKNLSLYRCPKLVALYENNYCEYGTSYGLKYSCFLFPELNEKPYKRLKHSSANLKYMPSAGVYLNFPDDDYVFSIVKQPKTVAVDKECGGSVSIEAVGDGLIYLWKCSMDYGLTYITLKEGPEPYADIAYEDTDEYYMIQCVVNDAYGSSLKSYIVDVLFVPENAIAINENNFPDPAFRAFIEDASPYSSLYLSEKSIKNMTELTIDDTDITSIKGIELLSYLKRLIIKLDKLEEINLGDIPVTNLVINGCHLSSLDLSDNSELTRLVLSNGSLEELILGDNKLQNLLISDCRLSPVDLSMAESLQKININDSMIENINLGPNPNLTVIEGEGNGFDALDLSRCTALSEIRLSGNTRLDSLALPQNGTLNVLALPNSGLSSVDIGGCGNLKSLDLSHNNVSELDVSDYTLLESLNVSYNCLKELDVSKNEQLKELFCDHNELESIKFYDIYPNYNILLRKVWCHSNKLKALDISNLEILLELRCYDNDLNYLFMGGGQISRHAYAIISGRTMANMYKKSFLTDVESGCEYIKYEYLLNDKDWVYLYIDPDTLTAEDANDWLSFTEEPADLTVVKGGKALFKVKAEGQGLRYRWWYKVLGDSEWHSFGDEEAKEVELEYDDSLDGAEIWCRIYDIYGQYKDSRKAVLTYVDELPLPLLKYGDVDGDGDINLRDLTVLRRFLAGGWDVTVFESNADVDKDGTLSPKDVTLLRRFLVGNWGVVL